VGSGWAKSDQQQEEIARGRGGEGDKKVHRVPQRAVKTNAVAQIIFLIARYIIKVSVTLPLIGKASWERFSIPAGAISVY
jgi:hypothetical protein